MTVLQCPNGHMAVMRADDHAGYHCYECDYDPHGDDPAFGEDEVESARVRRNPRGTVPRTTAEIRNRANIHTDMVTFEYGQHDRIDLGLDVDGFIDGLAPTVREFTLGDFAKYVDGGTSSDLCQAVSDRLWMAHNVPPLEGVSEARRIYLNPDYVHLDACGPPGDISEKRLRYYILTAASLGHVHQKDIKPVLGIDSVREYVPDWDERRTAGKIRMANTLVATLEWSDRSKTAVSTAYGLPRQTANDYINRYAELESVPPDPSRKIWGTGGFNPDHWKVELAGGDPADV